MVLSGLLTAACFAQSPKKTGITTTQVELNLYRGGKPVGKTKLPAGREVNIVAELSSGYTISPFPDCRGLVPKAAVIVKEEKKQNPPAQPTTAQPTVPKSSPDSDIPNTGGNGGTAEFHDNKAATASSHSIVQPGKLVYLRPPATDQHRTYENANTGCILAMLDFLKSDTTPSEDEFEKLMNSHASEPSKEDERRALQQLGYSMEILAYEDEKGEISDEAAEKMESDVVQFLDKGSPLTATKDTIYEALAKGSSPNISAGRRKTFVLVGYNMATKTFYAWRPEKTAAERSIGKYVDHPPQGLFEIPMGSLSKRSTYLHYLQRFRTGKTPEGSEVSDASNETTIESREEITQVIGPEGGKIKPKDPASLFHEITIVFPKGALPQETKVTLSVLPRRERARNIPGIESGVWGKLTTPEVESFKIPAEIQVRYEANNSKSPIGYIIKNKQPTHSSPSLYQPYDGKLNFAIDGPFGFTWFYVPLIKAY